MLKVMPFAVMNPFNIFCRAMTASDSAELFETIAISAFKNKSLHAKHTDGMPAICNMPEPESRRMAAIKNLLVYLSGMHYSLAGNISLAFINLKKQAILLLKS